MKLQVRVTPYRKPNLLVEQIFRASGSFNEGKYPAFPADVRILCDEYGKAHNEVIEVEQLEDSIMIKENSFKLCKLDIIEIYDLQFPDVPNAKIS